MIRNGERSDLYERGIPVALPGIWVTGALEALARGPRLVHYRQPIIQTAKFREALRN